MSRLYGYIALRTWAKSGVDTTLLSLLIEKAVVWEDKLEIEFKTDGVKSLMEGLRNG